MIITYQGKNYFKIQSGESSILIDPENQRSLRGANAAVNTLLPAATPAPEGDECFWIDHQGEYEVRGIHVRGWSVGKEENYEKTIYRIVFDDVTIAVFGHLTAEPPKQLLEYLEDADIVIIPAGEKPYLAAPAAAKLLRQIEPAVVIPSLFKDPRPFLKELNHGNGDIKPEERFVFKKKDLEPKAMAVRWLEAK